MKDPDEVEIKIKFKGEPEMVWNPHRQTAKRPNSIVTYRILVKEVRQHKGGRAFTVDLWKTIARWKKPLGLCWRIAPSLGYGQDDLSCYWPIRDGSSGAIVQAIRSVGEYLTEGQIDQETARELLDFMNAELQDRL